MKTHLIERYLADDLEPAARAAVEAELAADAALRAHVEQRRRDKAAFLLDPRRRRFAALAEDAAVRSSSGGRAGRWVLVLATSASAAAAVWLLSRPPASQADGAPASVVTTAPYAIKGGVSVKLAVQSAGRVRPYTAGAPLRAGDRVRISVDDPHGGYVTVLFEDERAVNVLYHPQETGRLPPGRHMLPGSLELDAVTGRERIYVLISPQPPAADAWRAQITSARGDAGFDHGWLPRAPTRITTIEYQKVAE